MKKENKAVNYIKESLGELKKVTWPKKDEVVSSTLIVIVVIITISAILGVFDIGVGEFIRYLFRTASLVLTLSFSTI